MKIHQRTHFYHLLVFLSINSIFVKDALLKHVEKNKNPHSDATLELKNN